MKTLHRDDLFGWSVFDEARNVDFHGTFWAREGGVLVDPLPMSSHDLSHVASLGGAKTIVVTNSDHVRAATSLAAELGAKMVGPVAEREALGWKDARWVSDSDEVVKGLTVVALEGSKTPGELALLLEGTTLITGDLVRGQRGGRLNRLPDAKLTDVAAAERSIARLAALEGIEAVIVGDGWPIFTGGGDALRALAGGG